MAAKTLSTSTLSLKFMQNAHRAKNLAEVQLERAEVKDDGEWEVAKEIRDAWGPETTQVQSVSYEASYLPFLFTSDTSDLDATPAANLKGRRAFKRGREVADEYQPVDPASPATAAKAPAASTFKSAGKPKQISSLSGRTGNSNSNSKKACRLRRKARRPARQFTIALPPPPNVFLKPAGVDEPAESTKSASTAGNTPTPSSDSAERKPKGKREREQTADSAEGESSKKRKRRRRMTRLALPNEWVFFGLWFPDLLPGVSHILRGGMTATANFEVRSSRYALNLNHSILLSSRKFRHRDSGSSKTERRFRLPWDGSRLKFLVWGTVLGRVGWVGQPQQLWADAPPGPSTIAI
ncbi:hypothetical protein B0H13DRAFT_2275928 [Mycena leptocephala]|nr:hypothetical protein B0H13DRAFT_2275928 [Mycena leptocephala]